VIDVGYAGPIGAERIVHGTIALRPLPGRGRPEAVRPADREGEIRARIQTNGRCESANPNGETYGPMSYIAYIPGYAILGWSGKWDDLPASHFTAIAFDLLCVLGLALAGRRFGGNRLGVTLAFAWAAYPFTQYASMSNTNDAIMPALPDLGLLVMHLCLGPGRVRRAGVVDEVRSPAGRAALGDLPEFRKSRRTALIFAGAFAVATVASFWVLLLEPSVLGAAHEFWKRTIVPQVKRESPFSLWDWRQYHAGLPDPRLAPEGAPGVCSLPAQRSSRSCRGASRRSSWPP
jgi:hypothetical protein